MDDDAIRTLVKRLARPHGSGGAVIERAAIMAAGSDSAEVLAWIAAHDGRPEALPEPTARGGLHGARVDRVGASDTPTPRRYVFPPGSVS
jgi:hypothetical protein